MKNVEKSPPVFKPVKIPVKSAIKPTIKVTNALKRTIVLSALSGIHMYFYGILFVIRILLYVATKSGNEDSIG